MKKLVCGVFALGIVITCTSAFALNYHELEVYGYAIEGPGVVEIENITSHSTGVDKSKSTITRSTFEGVFGLSERWEAAAYLDMRKLEDGEWKYAGFRARARTFFFEQGEKPVDIGAYVELELPEDDEELGAIEGRLILEKTMGRWVTTLNPIVELELERERTATEVENELELKVKYAAGLSYRFHPRFLPSVNLFGDFDKDEHLAGLAGDYNLKNGFAVGLLVGKGLTKATEQTLVAGKFEYEY